MILDNHRIIDQGKWKDIKAKTEKVSKISISKSANEANVIAADFDRLEARQRTKEETEIDVTRQRADSALYGE